MIYHALDSALDALQSMGVNPLHLLYVLPALVIGAYVSLAVRGSR